MTTLQTTTGKGSAADPGASCAIESVDPETARRWRDADEAVIIDVREPGEYRGEHIDGAVNVPLSGFDPSNLPALNGRKVVIHCKSGTRAKQACGKLADAAAGQKAVYNMGGIDHWKKAGLPTVQSAGGAIDIVRQVHLVVGTMVLAGSVLAWLVSPWFLLLTGFFGAGLLFAGASGFCGMAMLLARMPWNR